MLKKFIALFILAIFPFTSFIPTSTAQQNTNPEKFLDDLMSYSEMQELMSRYESTFSSYENKTVEAKDLALELAYHYQQIFTSDVKNNTYNVKLKNLHNDLVLHCWVAYTNNPNTKHIQNCAVFAVVAGICDNDEDLFATMVAYADFLTLDKQNKDNTYYLKQPLLQRLFAQNNINAFYDTNPSFVNFTVKRYSINPVTFSSLQKNLKSAFNITLLNSKP
ncbi:hypothetical protein [Psittacicella gerlachiana]|uniref:Uncharacterized protein n=1 Tax=Psittacicella gerlachiana TaxID=2028574 RepID=A0A3A1YMW2_9GAMM|nr:hypothetical protein [Psittacicella gerlachiana]RIY38796.1 hypothetical protein CKF59_00255 [Psittacicella gerlachiana]